MTTDRKIHNTTNVDIDMMASIRRISRITSAILARNQSYTSTVRRTPKRLISLTRCLADGKGVLKDGEDPLSLPKTEWEKRLSAEQYYITREKGTEAPFTGNFYNHAKKGSYTCICCGSELFSSESKYDSGSGWPSFWAALGGDKSSGDSSPIMRKQDGSHGMSRTEVVCKKCDAHLGHVFPDGPRPTGERYCINSVSLGFKPKSESESKTTSEN